MAIWLGYFAFAMWIMPCCGVADGRFEIHGYDYSDYKWFLTDWHEILYPRPRHPLWGVFFFPLALALHGIRLMSPLLCALLLNAIFAAVMSANVWMVASVLKCGWGAGLLYASFASSLLLGGMPESFGISALIALIAIHWFVEGRAGNKRWLALSLLAGGITVTQGVKLVLLRYGFLPGETWRMRLCRLCKIGAWGVVAVIALGLVFVIVWAGRKLNNPSYSRTLLDMVKDLGAEFSYSGMGVGRILNRWWVFLSEPILTRGTPFEDNGIVCGYPLWIMNLLPGALLAVSAVGAWLGRGLRLTRAVLVFLLVDLLIHFLCGWGMWEPHLYGGHWTYAVPVLCSLALSRDKTNPVIYKGAQIFFGVVAAGVLMLNLRMYGVL